MFSPDLCTIAYIPTNLLLARNFRYNNGLFNILNAKLNILAISSQAKQSIIPALVGILNMAEVQLQG